MKNMEPEDLKILPVPEISHESKETRKKQKQDHKKGEKKINHAIKSLANCTLEEKVDTLCKKNNDSLDQVHDSTSSVQLLQNRVKLLEKETEQLQNEQSKEVLVRFKLECLYGELQRQNKSFKDESMQKIREEEEKLKQLGKSFQASLEEANELAKLTIDHVEYNFLTQREKWAKEKESYEAELKLHNEQNIKHKINNNTLELQITHYINKLGYFETAIAKSSEMFDNYQSELNNMRKQIRKLEQDNIIWKDKLIKSQHVLKQKGLTENNESCEISAITEEKSCVSDLVNTDKSKTDSSAQNTFANDENKQNANPVCVNVEEQVNLAEQKTKSVQSVKHEQ